MTKAIVQESQPVPGSSSQAANGATHGDLKIIFGRNLRSARERGRLSQGKLAAQAGITQSYVANVEGGKANITIETMATLADAVGWPLPDLLTDANQSVAA